jgi:hypothetical protein
MVFWSTETPEHHFAAVANTITPEDGRIRPKHVDSYNTCNKAIHLCIKLDTHLPYDHDARSHIPQIAFRCHYPVAHSTYGEPWISDEVIYNPW